MIMNKQDRESLDRLHRIDWLIKIEKDDPELFKKVTHQKMGD